MWVRVCGIARGNLRVVEAAFHPQPCDARKRPNPTAIFRICLRDNLGANNKQGVGIIRRRVGRIREGLLPPLEVSHGTELDTDEKEPKPTIWRRDNTSSVPLDCHAEEQLRSRGFLVGGADSTLWLSPRESVSRSSRAVLFHPLARILPDQMPWRIKLDCVRRDLDRSHFTQPRGGKPHGMSTRFVQPPSNKMVTTATLRLFNQVNHPSL